MLLLQVDVDYIPSQKEKPKQSQNSKPNRGYRADVFCILRPSTLISTVCDVTAYKELIVGSCISVVSVYLCGICFDVNHLNNGFLCSLTGDLK